MKGKTKMKSGDKAIIITDKGGHLFKGAEVEIVKILSPRNEKPILVKPIEGFMGGWFNKEDLKLVEE